LHYAQRERSVTPRLPLDGIRVIELTRYAAGPLAGYLLSSLGAEVIKIEPPGGEDTRAWTPRFGDVSGYFANFNAGKRLVSVDLKDAAERARIEDLFATADVVLHNMRPGAMEKLGFGAEALTARYRSLIYCAISGYGLHGPKLPALDTVIQARVGLTALTGDGGRPLRVGYSIADQLAGHYAAAAIMAALADRDTTGLGQIVDVSMADAIAWLTHPAWNGEPVDDRQRVRLRVADGWVLAEASADHIASAVGDTREAPRATVVELLAEQGIASAAVLEVDEVLAQSELRARHSVYQAATRGGAAPVFVAPFGLTRTPVRRGERVAAVGEDNSLVTDREEAHQTRAVT
jgi:crotonobetainyl-CoA:carnitine CoA-transferase CaiB-like acyl-CoA transferase